MSKYGVYAELVASQAITPVSTATTVIILGHYISNKSADEPLLVTSKADFEEKYGTESCSLHDAAVVAFDMMKINQAVFINLNSIDEESDSDVPESSIIGTASAETGCYAIQKIYPKYGLTPDLVVCLYPCTPAVLAAIKANIVKANGHWDGMCLYDVEESSEQVVSGIANVEQIVLKKQIVDERFIACWGHIKTATGIYSSALYKACLLAKTDASYRDIPMRSIGNLAASDVSYITLQIVDSPISLSEAKATELADNGITSFINIGSNVYYTWGDSTSALTSTGIADERGRFDTTIRIMLQIGNRFQRIWRNSIDAPMNLGLRKDIITEEQSHLDYLKSIGALLGYPKCEFKPLDNTIETVQRGEFYFKNILTTTPPSRLIDLKTGFTSEGYAVLLEG